MYILIEYLYIQNILVIISDIINNINGIELDIFPSNNENNMHNIANKLYNMIFLLEYGMNELENDIYITPIIIANIKYKNKCGGTTLLNIKCFNPNIIEQITPYINKLFTFGKL